MTASRDLVCSACRALALQQTLPRVSTSAAAKKPRRQHLSTSAAARAPNSRPYALPDELRRLQQPAPSPNLLPPIPIQPHVYHQPELGASPLISAEYLEQLYSVLVPAPLTSLAAFASRLPHAHFTAEHTSLVELCCICPSFWDAVDAAQPMPTDRQGPYTNFWDRLRASNAELSAQGESFLGLFAHEYLEARYPHMPQRVMNDALTMYVGATTCSDIARLWGVWAGRTSALEMSPRQKKDRTGRTSGQGLLRWQRQAAPDLPTDSTIETEGVGPFVEAMASVARALVGAVFQEHGYDRTRQFVRANWFSRKADLMPLLKWARPSMVLMETLIKYNRPPSVSRLLKESGRDSHMPLFVVGIFSGGQKLGEGYGSSLKMAEWRAAEDSLRRIYLSRSFASSPALVDLHVEPPLPSDTLAAPGSPYSPRQLGDDEVEWGRAQTPFQSPREAIASPFRPSLDPPHRPSHEPVPPTPAHLRRPSRPLSGPGSRDPQLPLEHRLPRWLWRESASGPQGRREKGWFGPPREMRGKVQSPYSGPFEQLKPEVEKGRGRKETDDTPAV